MPSDKITYRKAEASDAQSILALINELAEYEHALDEVKLTADQLAADGFGSAPRFITEVAEKDGALIGMALSYDRYSTWKGKTLYLEDLIVKSAYRRMGVGAVLFDRVLERAKDGNYSRLEWQVLAWNEPAIAFYEKRNWESDTQWTNGRIRLK